MSLIPPARCELLGSLAFPFASTFLVTFLMTQNTPTIPSTREKQLTRAYSVQNVGRA
jgi:hypothetical protein